MFMNDAVLTAISAGDMPDALSLDSRLQADLRSDHAGETGAVWIYRGILTLSADPEIRDFAHEHLAMERSHLAFFEEWLPQGLRSRILPLWRVAGWLLGAISTLGGRRGVYLTIEAVESFVVEHYQEQIEYLTERREHREVRAALRRFQRDEAHHQEDARLRGESRRGLLAKTWASIVGEGSRLAVVAARKI
jgi:ubiquinone biosynthesis monooxygenase Coq7